MPTSERQETPPDFPETTPPRPLMTDYSFTLQAIMEVQKAVGQLTARVDELVRKSDSQGATLNRISHQLYAAWVVAAIVIVVGGFLLNHLWDPMMKLVTEAVKASAK
jgi:hypothetical protein